MSLRTRLFRLFAGLVVLALTLAGGFALFMAQMPRWGATPAEAALALPGDAQLSAPMISWTNARTINAPPDQVWPWLAQMGDTRGAFYSFTFIEDRIGALTGAADYAVNYTNANAIHPEWQNPQPGEEIIQGTLKWEGFAPGRWLLASSANPNVMGWTWLWQIAPTADGRATRLVNRIRIQPMGVGDNPVVSFFIGNGAFIMEQRMMHGIKAHAEGWVEPRYQEAVEIALWVVALLAGLAAAVLFVARRPWIAAVAVAVAVAAVGVILVFTFAQPPIAVRVLLDAALLAGVWVAWRTAATRPVAATP
ncbi:hypothetical protein [Candidatus Amarolinea aalborgensis]|uniref:hypothetical protein n=1 Tax=Candidatus Amarolinea aalborgensis TaxID=2249329 RepID=UPI003BF9824F